MRHKACQWSGCAAVVQEGQKFCQRHETKGENLQAERVKAYDDYVRPDWTVKFYHSTKWFKLRKQVLREQPICAMCNHEFSHHVDHIQPIRFKPDLAEDRDNLQGLCSPCHNLKTQREKKQPH